MTAPDRIALCAVVLCAVCCGPRAAAAADTALRAVSSEQFSVDLQHLHALAASCALQANSCDANAVVADEQVGDVEHGGFTMHWNWLRHSLETAKRGKPEERSQQMANVQTQLQHMAQESGNAPQPTDFAKARREADAVLRTPEFAGNGEPTWWDRKLVQIQRFIARLFDGVGRLGSMAPWLGRLLEWLLFLGAAVGLLVFLLRTLARQRRRLALGEGAAVVNPWQREATDWAGLASRHAEAAEYREAVHCLYWAAIVLLEGRRAWRHNPTRTPRDYVRLLKPASAQQQGLRGLTQVFERVWYGQREADAEAYRRAQTLFQQLETGTEATTPTPLREDAAGAGA